MDRERWHFVWGQNAEKKSVIQKLWRKTEEHSNRRTARAKVLGWEWVGFVLSGLERWWLKHSEYRMRWEDIRWEEKKLEEAKSHMTLLSMEGFYHMLVNTCVPTYYVEALHWSLFMYSFCSDLQTNHLKWILFSPYGWMRNLIMVNILPKTTQVGSREIRPQTYLTPKLFIPSQHAVLLIRLCSQTLCHGRAC